jgi:cellulose synthase/poly-beta-1,6-N-acetylglucosamine synthase-like glycosyltransferase
LPVLSSIRVRASVIVPAYNYARLLPSALESVLAQTHTDWECLIVDDGSTDDTAPVADAFTRRDARFRYLHQENRGLAAARNRGIRNAGGDAVQFLDADDRLMPRKLEHHLAYLEAHPECDIVYGETAFFRSATPDVLMPSLNGRLSRSIMARVHGSAEALRLLEHFNIMPVPAALVRRRVFEAVLFDEDARAVEDHGFWLRCAALGYRFDYCESAEPLAAVRAHAASMSRDHVRMLRGLIAVAHAYERSGPPLNGRLPLIYEMALGVETAERGARIRGMRRILRAASNATESLTRLRWRLYAATALLLPRRMFVRFVATPIPERPFELYRKLRAAGSRIAAALRFRKPELPTSTSQ